MLNYCIDRLDRSNLTHPPLLEFVKLDPPRPSNFASKTKTDPYDPNRFTLTLDLEEAYIADMGKYELRIHDDEDGSILQVIKYRLSQFTLVS